MYIFQIKNGFIHIINILLDTEQYFSNQDKLNCWHDILKIVSHYNPDKGGIKLCMHSFNNGFQHIMPYL